MLWKRDFVERVVNIKFVSSPRCSHKLVSLLFRSSLKNIQDFGNLDYSQDLIPKIDIISPTEYIINPYTHDGIVRILVLQVPSPHVC